MMFSEWNNTKRILRDIESVLFCYICKKTVKNPSVLGSCEHFYCRKCIQNYLIGENCPKCNLPSHAKEVTPNRSLATAVLLVRQLKALVGDTEWYQVASGDEEHTQQCSSKNLQTSTRAKKSQSNDNESTVNDTIKANRNKQLNSIAVVENQRARRRNRNLKSKGDSSHKVQVTNKDLAQENSNDKTASTSKFNSKKRKSDENAADSTPKSNRTEKYKTKQGSSERSSGSLQLNTQPWMSPLLGKRIKSPSCSPNIIIGTDNKTKKPSVALNQSFSSPSSTRGEKRNAKGETLLHQACIKGDFERVKTLLEQGVEINVKDHAGWTPLHEACNHGYKDIVEVLLDHGASVNVPGSENMTPLHDAIENGRVACVKVLVSRGANKYARNIHGRTPEDFAVTTAMKNALKTKVLFQFSSEKLSQTQTSPVINEVVILATGLSREQKISVQKCASLMHGQVVSEFCPKVTHVITSVNKDGKCPRTMKFLQAALCGKWILTFDWVKTCLEYSSRVPEEAFEVAGHSMSSRIMRPQASRLNAYAQLPGLFDGCNVFLSGNFNYPTPEKSQLLELLQIGGANILSREPKLELISDKAVTVPYHILNKTSKLADVGYYVVFDNKTYGTFNIVDNKIAKVEASWILDCIGDFELKDDCF